MTPQGSSLNSMCEKCGRIAAIYREYMTRIPRLTPVQSLFFILINKIYINRKYALEINWERLRV